MPEEFPYELTCHAAKAIAERGIPLVWIARILEQPQKTETNSDDPALRHALARIPAHGGRVLRVVYNSECQPWRIITAYFDRTQRSRL